MAGRLNLRESTSFHAQKSRFFGYDLAIMLKKADFLGVTGLSCPNFA